MATSRRRAKSATSPAQSETRGHIIDVAERLFADHGFAGVSLRTIVNEAGVNLAAVHYHFGSKEALFEAVYERRASRIAEARASYLARVCADGEPRLEDVLTAFLAPALRADDGGGTGGSTFARLRARMIAENSEFGKRLQATYFNKSSKAFIDVLEKILPNLPIDALYWRFNFMLGAMVYQMADVRRIDQLSDGQCSSGDVEEALARMVQFFASGFRAPEPEAKRKRTLTRRREA